MNNWHPEERKVISVREGSLGDLPVLSEVKQLTDQGWCLRDRTWDLHTGLIHLWFYRRCEHEWVDDYCPKCGCTRKVQDFSALLLN